MLLVNLMNLQSFPLSSRKVFVKYFDHVNQNDNDSLYCCNKQYIVWHLGANIRGHSRDWRKSSLDEVSLQTANNMTTRWGHWGLQLSRFSERTFTSEFLKDTQKYLLICPTERSLHTTGDASSLIHVSLFSSLENYYYVLQPKMRNTRLLVHQEVSEYQWDRIENWQDNDIFFNI